MPTAREARARALELLGDRDPMVRLGAVGSLRSILDRIEEPAVIQARNKGATWEHIGLALNRSKQAVQQKYGPIIDQMGQ